MRVNALALTLLLLAMPVSAQSSLENDPRIYTPSPGLGGVLRVPTSAQLMQIILFDAGERIQSVIISDPNAYIVQVAGSADSISLKAIGFSDLVRLSARTDRRTYEFELAPGEVANAPAIIRAGVPGSSGQAPAPVSAPVGERRAYRLSGDKALRPVSVSADATKTYVEWHDDQSLPAIFAVVDRNREEMVDGYMRGSLFTIDRVYPRLVFRIDRRVAQARLEPVRGCDGR
jgi:type IV secretion system protein VirB9